MRAAFFCLCLLFSTPHAASAQVLAGGNPRCDATQVAEPILLIGRKLRETPDLSPELQRINLMSNVNGCYEYSYQKFVAYQQQHPDDIGSNFLTARYIWRMGDIKRAIEHLEGVVREHPDFASGLVLLGAMHRERSSLTPASEYLQRALKISPDDLWGNINLLKLNAQTDADPAARAKLMEIALAEHAPKFTRSSSTDFLLQTMNPHEKGSQYESLLRVKLTYVEGHFREETLFRLADLLVRQERHAEARPLLLELLNAPNIDQQDVRAVQAESYLREALGIAPGVTAANQALVDQARAAVANDFSRLAARTAWDPELSRKLQPFFRTGEVASDARDGMGNTSLCAATHMGDMLAMQDLIRAGADVNADCGDRTALGVAVTTGNADLETRKTMFAYLLHNGANPDIAFDGSPGALEDQCQGHPECRDNLLPILKTHREAAAKSR